jgi:ribonuclease P protein subunit RPR2|tara:strand:+ start:3156 stop:3473 length:318 start_codon:yes stop_codon:yes gene_type:complete
VAKQRGRRSKKQENIARTRIDQLFNLALDYSNEGNSEESKKVIGLALLISKRYNQRLTKKQRMQICRNCNMFFNADNSRNRLSPKGWKVITCLECNHLTRFLNSN